MSVPFGPVYPESAYRKIFQLVADSEKPALHEHLQWEIEYGERADEFECLGPRPRRGDLFLILGDLEDEGALVATPEGIDCLLYTSRCV